TMDKHQDGSLAMSVELRSNDGKIIVRVERGEFTINPNNYFKKYRKDRSSLEVIDQNGKSILNLRFFNPRAMWINASLPGVEFNGSLTSPTALCTGNPAGQPMLRLQISDKAFHSWFTVGDFR
ncbi:MAG: hypothetical protein KGS09_11525, partial [Nitrospirae bacterium]|nr:hypothetical protein [Nitrospirota bacterium]